MDGLRGRQRPPIILGKPVAAAPQVTFAPVPTLQDAWGAPPPGYIPGRGRGATGFSGGVSRDDASSAHVGGPVICAEGSLWGNNREDYSESKFDKFSGFDENLFGDTVIDEEDREAERVFEKVEASMDQRRKRQRDLRLLAEVQKQRSERSTLQQTFSDLRSELATVAPEEWDALPDIGDTRNRKKRKNITWNRETPLTEGMLAAGRGAAAHPQLAATADLGIQTPLAGTQTPLSAAYLPGGGATMLSTQTPLGLATPLGMQTPLSLSTPISMEASSSSDGPAKLSEPWSARHPSQESRGSALESRLDAVKCGTMTSVADPEGLLTQLRGAMNAGAGDVADLKKMRALMKSIVKTNPRNPSGWIAYARLEMKTGRASKARDIIAQGCTQCPTSEELWLEAADMQGSKEDADDWLAASQTRLPKSVKIWLKRAELRSDAGDAALSSKRSIYREALEQVTNSVQLWREAAQAETPEDARTLLLQAVSCLPHSSQLWLDLTNLASNVLERKQILNEACKKCAGSIDIWLAALQTMADGVQPEPQPVLRRSISADICKMVHRAIKRLRSAGNIEYDRTLWLKAAVRMEQEKHCIPAVWAIIKAVGEVSWPEYKLADGSVDIAKFKNDRLVEISSVQSQGANETTLALLNDGLQYLPQKKVFWRKLVDVVRDDSNLRKQALMDAVQHVPAKRVFWFELADLVLRESVAAAQRVLEEGISHLPQDLELLIRKIKLDTRHDDLGEALKYIEKGVATLGHCDALYKHKAIVLRRQGLIAEAVSVVTEGLEAYPTCEDLWLMKAQLTTGDATERENILRSAIKVLPKSSKMWIALIDALLTSGKADQARACRERATQILPQSEAIWLEAIKIERLASARRHGDQLRSLIAKAQKACANSGLIWWESIWLEPPATRGARVVEGLKATNNSVYMIMAAARTFELEGKLKKAGEWYTRALDKNGLHNGDVHVAYLSFLRTHEQTVGSTLYEDQLRRSEQLKLNEGIRWWLPIKKDVVNSKLSVREVLQIASDHYGSDIRASMPSQV